MSKEKNFGRFGDEAQKILTILSDDRGRKSEERALQVAKGPLKNLFKRIRYSVDPCIRDERGRKQKGRDLKFTILWPRILKRILPLKIEKEIYLEIKSSRGGAKEHRNKGIAQPIYRTGVVIVNSGRSDQRIALSMFNLVKNETRKLLRDEIEKKRFFKRLPEKLLDKFIKWLAS